MAFDDRYKVGPPNACWLWTGKPGNHGYGRYGRSRQLAHRIAWEQAFGKIPGRLCVLHTCDNRICVNPAHLFLGTRTDNAADRDAKGRTARGARHGSQTSPGSLPAGDAHWRRTKPHLAAVGSRHGSAKLDDDAVRMMREARKKHGYTYAEAGDLFDVAPSTAADAITGRTWKHVK